MERDDTCCYIDTSYTLDDEVIKKLMKEVPIEECLKEHENQEEGNSSGQSYQPQ